MGDRDAAMDAAVKRLDRDLVEVEKITDTSTRGHARAAAEDRYLNAVKGPDHA